MNVKLRRFFILAGVLSTLTLSSPLWADPPSRVGRVNLLEGSVSFRPAVRDEWTPATLNYPLTCGDSLQTQAGARAELHLAGAAVRLAAGTDFSVLILDDRAVQLHVARGSLNVRLRNLPPGESFEVETPQASVSLLEPGSYRIDVRAEGGTELTVRSGRAEMAVAGSSVIVSADQRVILADRGAAAFAFRVAPGPDAWELWCLQRDQREDRYAIGPHVPTTLVGYEDLYEWGSWQRLPDYGVGWRPRGVPAGWAPYRFGHWARIEPWGWTWIDDAPWGFAPFHYGRWVFLQGAWYWIPGTFVGRPVYAPALVVFIGGPEWRLGLSLKEGIGWFPLGPRETYVPPYRTSEDYVLNLNGARRVDNGPRDAGSLRYVNRAVPGAITVVSRQSFVRSEAVAGSAVHLRDAEIEQAPVRGTSPFIVPEQGNPQAQTRRAGSFEPQAQPQAQPQARLQTRTEVRPQAPAAVTEPEPVPDRPAVVRQAPLPGPAPTSAMAPNRAAERPGWIVADPPPRGPIAGSPAEPRQPEQARQSEPRQPEPRQPEQVRQPEPRQSGQVRQPEQPRQSGKIRQGSAGSPNKLKRVRRLVEGPNGPVWVWVEVE
jgi:hypothetical protein